MLQETSAAIDRVAGAQPGVAAALVEPDRVVPPAFEVGEPAEVVEHDGLTVEVAELLVDLERADRVRRELGLARARRRPSRG